MWAGEHRGRSVALQHPVIAPAAGVDGVCCHLGSRVGCRGLRAYQLWSGGWRGKLPAAADRLARDQFIAAALLARIAKAKVALHYYQERAAQDLATATGKFTTMLAMFGGEISREKQIGHMVDALMTKAKNTWVHGGATFGYTNVRVNGHVERRIDAEMAKVIRRIFREYVGGRTLKQIVAGLNRDRVPTPSYAGGWHEPGDVLDRTAVRGLAWSKATVRAVLRRSIYRGLVTSRWKQAGETFEHSVPALRIIDDTTWKEANRLLTQATRVYLRHTDGKLWGKPASNAESPYLLTGMLACGLCGSVMGAESRVSGHDGKRIRVYPTTARIGTADGCAVAMSAGTTSWCRCGASMTRS